MFLRDVLVVSRASVEATSFSSNRHGNQRKKQKNHLNEFFISVWVPDSCHTKAGQSSRDLFLKKVCVNAVFFVFLDLGWVLGAFSGHCSLECSEYICVNGGNEVFACDCQVTM